MCSGVSVTIFLSILNDCFSRPSISYTFAKRNLISGFFGDNSNAFSSALFALSNSSSILKYAKPRLACPRGSFFAI